MSNAPQEVTVTFRGDASQLIATTGQVAAAMRGVGQSTQSVTTGTIAMGAALGSILAKLASKATTFAQDSILSFKTIGIEVYKMQLVVGGTAEEMSRLRYVSNMVGIDAAAVARGLGIASGAIAHNSDKWKQLGIAAKDSSGKTRPWTQLLPEVADKFRALGGSIDRTAAMKQIFGRGFAAVEPLMNLGGDAIRRFMAEAEKMGVVLGDKDVQAARDFQAAQNQMKASLQGVGVALGQVLLPIFGTFVKTLTDAVNWIRQVWQENGTLKTVIQDTAIVLGGLIAAMYIYKGLVIVVTGLTKLWQMAQAGLDAVMAANPIGLVVGLIIALIAALVWLVKTHKQYRDVFVKFGEMHGAILGAVVQVTVKSFRVMKSAANTFLSALSVVLKTEDFLHRASGGILGFDVPDGIIQGVDKVKNAVKEFDGLLKDVEALSIAKGAEWGKSVYSAVWDFIDKLKVPTWKDLLPPAMPSPTDELIEMVTPTGGTNILEDRKKAILEFFTNLVRTSRDALNALRRAAVDARNQMQEESRKIAQTLRDSLNITGMVEATWAKYLGVGALMRGFRRKLDQMKQFVADIRQLKSMGLPVEMLSQIANAGVEGGAAAARLLVQNPAAITDLQKMQQEITSVTAEAGQYVSTALFGGEVEMRERAARQAQLQYRGYVDKARMIGYVPTSEDLEAYNANIHNEVTINATTMADPKMIADAVAWALKTGIALGMKPAPAFMATSTPTKTSSGTTTSTKTYSTGGGVFGTTRS